MKDTNSIKEFVVELKSGAQNASDYDAFATSTKREDDVVLKVIFTENDAKLIAKAREFIKSMPTGCSVRLWFGYEEAEGMEWDCGSQCSHAHLLIYDDSLFLECTNKYSQDTIEWEIPEPDWSNLQSK